MRCVTIFITNDPIVEPRECFEFSLTSTSGAILPQPVTPVCIIDDDGKYTCHVRECEIVVHVRYSRLFFLEGLICSFIVLQNQVSVLTRLFIQLTKKIMEQYWCVLKY